MMEQNTILHISDRANSSNSVLAAFKETGYEVVSTNTPTQGVALLYVMHSVAAVVLDNPFPLDPYLAEALRAWLEHVRYNRPEDWVFANSRMKGRQPYWGQEIMRRVIRPIAIQLGITKHIGWHTFRHTYSTLLRANRADIKVMQELLRHASSRVTMDTYTQAVTAQKRKAQSGVIRLLRVRAMAPTTGA